MGRAAPRIDKPMATGKIIKWRDWTCIALRARYSEAMAPYREAPRLQPGYAEAERNRAIVSRCTGEAARR